MARANHDHSKLSAPREEFWARMSALANAELKIMETESHADRLSLVIEMSDQYIESRYLGLGTSWSADGKKFVLGTANAYLSKFGGLPEGSFIVLLPVLEPTLSKIKDSEIPKVAMIARVAAPPRAANEQEHNRLAKAIQDFPSSGLNIDTASLCSLHDVSLDLIVEKYVTQSVDDNGDEEAFIRYTGDCSFNISPVAWMALHFGAQELSWLLDLKPSETAFPIGRLSYSEHRPQVRPNHFSTPSNPVYFDPKHLFRTRSAFLGASGSGKSNLIKNILLGLKGPASKISPAEKIGILLMDPQGEYAESNSQGEGLAETLNKGRPFDALNALVYSFADAPPNNPSRKALKLNFYQEPRSAIELIAALDGRESGFVRNFVNVSFEDPFQLLDRFWSLTSRPLVHQFNKSIIEARARGHQITRSNASGRQILNVFQKIAAHPSYTDLHPIFQDINTFDAQSDSNDPAVFPKWVAGKMRAISLVENAKTVNWLNRDKEKRGLIESWVKCFSLWLILAKAGYEFDPTVFYRTKAYWMHFFYSLDLDPFGFVRTATKPAGFPSAPTPPNVVGGDPQADFVEKMISYVQTAADVLEDTLSIKSGAGIRASLCQTMNRKSADIVAVLGFFAPTNANSVGPASLSFLRPYHGASIWQAERELLAFLEAGGTVIVNLADTSANASPKIKQFFSDRLCKKLFSLLSERFIKPQAPDEPDDSFNILVVLEEAQEVMPSSSSEETIYKKMALMGRKLGLGVIFATQSPTNIDADLLKQASIAFVLHLPALSEITFLIQNQPDLETIKDRAKKWSQPGQGHFWRKGGLVIPLRCAPFPLPELLAPHPSAIAPANAAAPIPLHSRQCE